MNVMDYTFLNDNLQSIFNGLRVDKSALEQLYAEKDNSFILTHNSEAISDLFKFLSNTSENVFVLNGFMGAGKTSVSEFVLDFLDEDVLVFKTPYQEAINLDDVLLSLFKDFSVYHNEKKLQLPKIETNVFTEKINAYVKACNQPMLFIFDSFEINLKSQELQKDLLGFIDYLSHFEKVKIIISSRTFRADDLLSTSGSSSCSLKALNIDEVVNYLKINGIDGSSFEKEAIYKATRGHYLFLELSVLLMKMFGLSLTSFTNEYQKSSKNYIDFLVSRILSAASDKFVKLLAFLSVIRHGISLDFLIMSQLASSDDIEFLMQKHIISEKFGKYYIKDYVKSEYSKNIDTKTKIKVHKYIIDLYESELPLKPFERNLFLSRQTMRQEISYHLSKIDSLQIDLVKTGKPQVNVVNDINYLSYSRTSSYDEKAHKTVDNVKPVVQQKKSNDVKGNIEVSKNIFISKFSKPKEILQENIFEKPSIVESKTFTKKSVSNVFDEIPDTIDDYIKIAQDYENAYNYASSILYYKKALTYTADITYVEKEPILYSKLAVCYRKIQDIDSAVNAYEKVYDIYLKQDAQKANDVLLSIARMYSETYNFDKAKEYYERILSFTNGLSASLIIRVYLDLSELEDNAKDSTSAVKYMQKALNEAEKNTDIKVLLECYFRFALLHDDMGNTDIASKYYLKCVQSSNNPEINTFMSSAYSNLAEISLDSNNYAAAKMYYELSLEADKKQNNNEGLYYSYSKLSQIYQKDNPEKAYELLLKALECAKKLENINYAVTAYIEIGEHFIKIKEYKQALMSYVLAKKFANPLSMDGLYVKVIERMNSLKVLVGEAIYEQIIEEMKKNK